MNRTELLLHVAEWIYINYNPFYNLIFTT